MTGSTDLPGLLKTKVEKLINHCEQLRTDQHSMQERIRQLEAEKSLLEDQVRIRQSEIATLHQRVEILKNAEALTRSDAQSAAMKSKINELMREIDNCIALLSK